MPRPDGPQFNDPTLFQGTCFTCGQSIRSQSFRTFEPMSRYTHGPKGNIAGTVIHPEEALYMSGAAWEHYPRGDDEHPFSTVAYGVEHEDGVYPSDRRTHEQDWERQHREWQAKKEVEMHDFTRKAMKELEKD